VIWKISWWDTSERKQAKHISPTSFLSLETFTFLQLFPSLERATCNFTARLYIVKIVIMTDRVLKVNPGPYDQVVALTQYDKLTTNSAMLTTQGYDQLRPRESVYRQNSRSTSAINNLLSRDWVYERRYSSSSACHHQHISRKFLPGHLCYGFQLWNACCE
jgi:hypothetical protein